MTGLLPTVFGVVLLVLICGVATPRAQAGDAARGPGFQETFELEGFRSAWDLQEAFEGRAEPAGNAKVTYRLPKHYNTTDAFPIFVFLDGGYGATGVDFWNTEHVADPETHIFVNIPHFIAGFTGSADFNETYPRTREHYEWLRDAHAGVLAGLKARIPNIDFDRSVLGGHSNGGHTVALFLMYADATILEHYGRFYMLDGGSIVDYEKQGRLGNPALAGRSYYLAVGSEEIEGYADTVATEAQKHGLDFTVQKLDAPWIGHGFNTTGELHESRYVKGLRTWLAAR